MAVEDVQFFFDTFNVVTVGGSVISGLLFGFFAFLPFIRRLVPAGPPPPTARQALVGTFVVLSLTIGTITTVFYLQQIAAEIVVNRALYMRAVGRFCSFLVFDVVLSLGVALAVWREYTRHQQGS